jgi:hypothetical protein
MQGARLLSDALCHVKNKIVDSPAAGEHACQSIAPAAHCKMILLTSVNAGSNSA